MWQIRPNWFLEAGGVDGMCEGMRADSTGNKWHSDEPLSAPPSRRRSEGSCHSSSRWEDTGEENKPSDSALSATSVTSKKAGRRICPGLMFQKCFSSNIPCLCCGLLWNLWVSEVWQVAEVMAFASHLQAALLSNRRYLPRALKDEHRHPATIILYLSTERFVFLALACNLVWNYLWIKCFGGPVALWECRMGMACLIRLERTHILVWRMKKWESMRLFLFLFLGNHEILCLS